MHNNKEVEVEVEDLCVHSATCLPVKTHKNTLFTGGLFLNASLKCTDIQFDTVATIFKKIQTYKQEKRKIKMK